MERRESPGHTSKAKKISAAIKGPIFLTGFMGTGKTRIGRVLATRMQRMFLDTDRLVEEGSGKTISEIFAAEGEDRFRQLEHDCVSEAAGRADAVIALGGGAIADERNWDVIRRAGVVVALEASVDTILKRVSRRNDRPLLAGLNREEKRDRIAELLAVRAPFYKRADIRLSTRDKQTPEATAGELVRLMERWCEDR